RSFASPTGGFMRPTPHGDLYSPREIARAAGVPEAAVRQALADGRDLVTFDEAVRVGPMLVQRTPRPDPGPSSPAIRLPPSLPGDPPPPSPLPHPAVAGAAAGRLEPAPHRGDRRPPGRDLHPRAARRLASDR